MPTKTTRRKFLHLLAVSFGWLLLPARAQVDTSQERKRNEKDKRQKTEETNYVLPSELADFAALSLVLGRVSDQSVTVSVLSTHEIEGYIEYGTDAKLLTQKTRTLPIATGNPAEVILETLKPDTEYFYRLLSRNTETINAVYIAGNSAPTIWQTCRDRAESECQKRPADLPNMPY